MARFNLFRKISFSLALLLVVGLPCEAQVASRDQLLTINDFSGGLNTKSSPMSLSKNQGDIVENLRFDSELGSLTKRDRLVTAYTNSSNEVSTGLFRFYSSDGTKRTISTHGTKIDKCTDGQATCTEILTLTSGERKWQWLTWNNRAIGTDGYNQPVKWDGSSTSATYLGSALATDSGAGSGPNGAYSYKVACYSSSYIVSLDQASNILTVVDNAIDLSMIPICPDDFLGESITGRKIYRTEAGGSTYKLVTTIANNTAVTYSDTTADGSLGATLSPTHTRKPPLGKYILINNDRLWLANNPTYSSRIYYGDSGSIDYFGEPGDTSGTNGGYFDVRKDDGDQITAIKNLLGLLTVFKNNTIQKIYTDGESPATGWAISDPFSFVGCQAPYSAVNTSKGIVYLGNNGIYNFNGQNSELLSEPVSPEIKDIQSSNFPNVWSEYANNTYYMAYASRASGVSTNNRVLILDMLTKAYSIDIMDVNVFALFNSGTDIEALYSGSSQDGTINTHTATVQTIIHKNHSDFTGTFDDMRYIPTTAGGSATSPILELAWDSTIDSVVSTIDGTSGVIDRPDTNGTYISPMLTINASAFDKVFWNEIIPATGGDITFAFRSGPTTTDTAAQTWSSEFGSATGSDISSVTNDSVLQYRISMSTSDIHYTPTIILQDNFNIKITYNIAGADGESNIPIRYRSGWLNFGAPGYKKTLKKLYLYYDVEDNATGTLSVQFENYEGDTDTFDIDYAEHTDSYEEYFTDGKFLGDRIRFTISEDSENDIKVKEMQIVYDIEPLI